MRLGKTTLLHFGSQVTISVSGFIATLYIARNLGSESLGLYTTTIAVLFWATVPVNAISGAMNKRISEGTDRSSFLAAGSLLILGFVGILALLALVLSPWTNGYVGSSVSGFLAVLLLGSGVLNIIGAGLKGQKKVGRAGVVQAANQLLRTVLQIGLLIAGYELGGLLIGHAVAFFLAGLLGIRYFDVSLSLPQRYHFRRLYQYARYGWLGTLQARAFGWMDTIVLAFFVGPGLIGIYEVAWNIASIVAIISMSIGQVLFPEMSELSAQDEYERIRHYLSEGLVFAGIFAIPGIVGATILGPRVLRIYRPEFQEGATILVILIVARTVAAFGGQFLNTINAVDRPDVAFRINLVFVVANVVLNFALVWAFGWHGAAVATALSATILLALGYHSLAAIIGSPSIPFREIFHEVIASGIMAVAVLSLQPFAPTGNFVTIGLVFIGALVYGACLLAVSDHIRSKAFSLLPDAVAVTR